MYIKRQRQEKKSTVLGVVNPPVMFHTSVNNPKAGDVVLMALLRRAGRVRGFDVVARGFKGGKDFPVTLQCNFGTENGESLISPVVDVREGVTKSDIGVVFGPGTLFSTVLFTELEGPIADCLAVVLDVEYDISSRDIVKTEIPKEQ